MVDNDIHVGNIWSVVSRDQMN